MATDLLLLTKSLIEASILIAAPIIVLYALVASRGKNHAKCVAIIVAIALLLGANALLAVWAGSLNGGVIVEIARNLTALAALIVIFVFLRHYIHAELTYLNSSKKAQATRGSSTCTCILSKANEQEEKEKRGRGLLKTIFYWA